MRCRSRRSSHDDIRTFDRRCGSIRGSRSLACALSRPEPADRRDGEDRRCSSATARSSRRWMFPVARRFHIRVLHRREDPARIVAAPAEHERGAAQVHSLGLEEFRLAGSEHADPAALHARDRASCLHQGERRVRSRSTAGRCARPGSRICADNVFLQHDLNIFNFIIQLNIGLRAQGRDLMPVAQPDFSMITDGPFALEPLPAGRSTSSTCRPRSRSIRRCTRCFCRARISCAPPIRFSSTRSSRSTSRKSSAPTITWPS